MSRKENRDAKAVIRHCFDGFTGKQILFFNAVLDRGTFHGPIAIRLVGDAHAWLSRVLKARIQRNTQLD